MGYHGSIIGDSFMPTQSAAAKELASLIATLQSERQEHVDAVAQIDATFQQFGITAAAPAKRRGRPRKTTAAAKPAKAAKSVGAAPKAVKKAKKGKRGSFAISGLDSILGFVKQAGKKGAKTGEIVKHWNSEGRSGDGYNTLGELVKAKKLKRENIEGERGSRYTAV
jgi:hypothetical protein